ncbi:MAG: ATP-binding protein [Pseudomonadota bacterium]
MDPRKNPFSPGAGIPPAAFVGRSDIMDVAEIAFDRTKSGLFTNDILLLGLRGVGKTVLLNKLHALAKSRGLETIKFEVPDKSGDNLAKLLVPSANTVLRRLDRLAAAEETLTRAAALLRNFAAIFKVKYEGFTFGASTSEIGGDTGNLVTDLPEILLAMAEAAKSRQTAVALFVDEVQYLSKEELSALTHACHEVAQAAAPFLFIGAGLPQLAALTGEAKSYAERLFSYTDVQALSAEATARALREAAATQSADFTEEATARVFEHTQGYPYFVQTWGKFAWDEAAKSPITAKDVETAQLEATAFLDQSLFRVRFDRTSDLGRTYLRGLAELGPGPHASGAVAKTLGTASSQIAAIRASLIADGMIYAPAHGQTEFTVPLFDAFMRRAMPKLVGYKPRRKKA